MLQRKITIGKTKFGQKYLRVDVTQLGNSPRYLATPRPYPALPKAKAAADPQDKLCELRRKTTAGWQTLAAARTTGK